MSLAKCRIIDLPKISDPRGNLTFIEGGRHVPFEIKRVTTFTMFPAGLSAAAMPTRICTS